MAKAVQLDFTNVKDSGGQFNPKHYPPGDYKAKIQSVATVKVKSGDNKGQTQWLWTIRCESGTYPYYTGFQENVLWKIRNLFTSAGVAIPKKRVNLDPNKIVGKAIGVSLDDDEYEGKMRSKIMSVIPLSELEDADDDEADDEDDEDEEDEEETEDSDDEDEDEEDSDEDEDEDEDEEEEEEPPPPPKRRAKKPAQKTKRKATADVTDDELEELDIEDI
jgi:hypothetical protein